MANLQAQLPNEMRIVVVGMGDAVEAQAIQRQYAPNAICLIDAQRTVYSAYAVGKAGIREMLAPGVVRAAIDINRSGISAGPTLGGDVLQMPSTFVIGADGVVKLAYYSRSIADHPSDAVLLGAVAS